MFILQRSLIRQIFYRKSSRRIKSMFKNLFDLSVKRSGFEIFGFYLTYSILGAIVAGVICGFVIAFVHPEIKTVEDATHLAIRYAPVLAIFYGLILACLIVRAKNLFNTFNAILLIIISVPLLFFFGLSLGLIPIAFLTGIEKSSD